MYYYILAVISPPNLCKTALSLASHHQPLPFNERSVCFASALSHSLFVERGSVCACTVLHLHYHIVFFVGRGACPSRCTKPFHPRKPLKSTSIPRPTPTLPKPHYPLPCTKLASLVKGRWLDGKAQTLTLLHLLTTRLPFLFTKLFCRQDGRIAFLPHSFRFSDTSVDNPSIVGCNRSSPLHKGAKGDSALPTLLKTALPSRPIIIQPN